MPSWKTVGIVAGIGAAVLFGTVAVDANAHDYRPLSCDDGSPDCGVHSPWEDFKDTFRLEKASKVDFSDIMAHPQDYSGKVIETKGYIQFMDFKEVKHCREVPEDDGPSWVPIIIPTMVKAYAAKTKTVCDTTYLTTYRLHESQSESSPWLKLNDWYDYPLFETKQISEMPFLVRGKLLFNEKCGDETASGCYYLTS